MRRADGVFCLFSTCANATRERSHLLYSVGARMRTEPSIFCQRGSIPHKKRIKINYSLFDLDEKLNWSSLLNRSLPSQYGHWNLCFKCTYPIFENFRYCF